ncbi:MAG: hypothetical protein ACRC2R_03580 [Xenococcaceae cyanobacterium]
MPKQYRYVGSSELIRSDLEMPERFCIRHSQDIFDWLKQTDRKLDRANLIHPNFFTENLGDAPRRSTTALYYI